ncbi:hypothetical protein P7C73_g6146, partial [Tremellales sp. Uapishka_1]
MSDGQENTVSSTGALQLPYKHSSDSYTGSAVPSTEVDVPLETSTSALVHPAGGSPRSLTLDEQTKSTGTASSIETTRTEPIPFLLDVSQPPLIDQGFRLCAYHLEKTVGLGRFILDGPQRSGTVDHEEDTEYREHGQQCFLDGVFLKSPTNWSSAETSTARQWRRRQAWYFIWKDCSHLERGQSRYGSGVSSLQISQVDLQALLASTQTTEREARRDLSSASEEMAALRNKHSMEVEDLERVVARKERERRAFEEELKESRDESSREKEIVRELKHTLATQSTQHLTLSAQLTASQTQCSILQAEVERAALSVSSMRAELEIGRQAAREAEEKADLRIQQAYEERDRRVEEIEGELRTAETIRRRLHNQVQELKGGVCAAVSMCGLLMGDVWTGNIRVFARVRPALPHESDSPDALAEIAYGDERTAQETGQSQIVLTSKSESATGKEREQVQAFSFDKVFAPQAGQQDVFEEISMLAQSVLDGYNVCIFAYGQTGSGKSWTMEGGSEEENAGMIPRAIDMIFKVSSGLKDRGWKYQMEGSFLEVYNEVINDLLGSGQFDSKKHEIKNLDGKVTVTETVSVPLNNPRQVSTLLERAKSRRAVAATLMNERSSRSHSVFSLKVKGINPLTDEKCEGILNLVDLAGSERLASSGAGENKDRMKETININKSLSALADVIDELVGSKQDSDAV